ncbi:hypothetical protein EDI_292670 [Entamoeba dispar SAW760]|uniref:Uncharacterized protein n=1 Tax=Entamoeba dispar (strain ATCC PRA-260 / SAW760) TaxID=370354 RepID=B0EMH9_ENTDS|nr:uncharacterized protein EDI_292670 [Entamoeba dispar SAW760]EDR24267.1 hypothetical protein EDI_292670 [Entamoeba dispar SAW760]|eukprot:EDR24267.1 hypothetical protein EDI_292670 [Entamoeba dispar SAW760]
MCDCFDQFKIMDVHICGDVSKGVSTLMNFRVCFIKSISLQVSTDNGSTWTDIDAADLLVDANHVYFEEGQAGEFIEYYNGNFYIGKPEHGAGYPVIATQVLSFPTVYGLASRRTVPPGFFTPSPTGVSYVEPSFDVLSSYSSFIYQSKLPGASLHLSLDVAGVSSSEKMMTTPTMMAGKLYKFIPENQNGRFYPFIMYGAKATLPTGDGDITDALSFIDDGGISWTGNAGIPQEEEEIILDNANVGGFQGSDAADVEAAYKQELANHTSVDSDGSYIMKIMGYITVRFKQLRSSPLEIVEAYNFVRCQSSWKDTQTGQTVSHDSVISLNGLGQFVQDGVSGFVIERGDGESWSDALKRYGYENLPVDTFMTIGSLAEGTGITSYVCNLAKRGVKSVIGPLVESALSDAIPGYNTAKVLVGYAYTGISEGMQFIDNNTYLSAGRDALESVLIGGLRKVAGDKVVDFFSNATSLISKTISLFN